MMKAAAWARIYELIFKLLLAYDDDEHDVLYRDDEGNEQYETWSRYEFLTRDADGAWCWDDDYLFACDSSLSLMSDRTELWQQVLADYQSGAYGNPGDPAALIHLWKMREELHYPLAGQTRRYLEAKQREAEEAAAAQARGSGRHDAGNGQYISRGRRWQPRDLIENRIERRIQHEQHEEAYICGQNRKRRRTGGESAFCE